jgi:hypothetical protein
MSEKREPDFAFEALADVTNTDWNTGRGELNKALKSIKEETGMEGYALAMAIRRNGTKYRRLFGDEVHLTPTALAKHWKRVEAETEKQRGQTNQAVSSKDDCPTCEGDRFVVVSTRQPFQTAWMKRHGHQIGESCYEEWAPCPDCNATIHEMRRHDGTKIATPDAARTRELMQR